MLVSSLFFCGTMFHVKHLKLESPLLGGDLGVGKAVIREIFTPLERSLRPKWRSFEKIQCGRGLKHLPNFLTGFTEISRPRGPTP